MTRPRHGFTLLELLLVVFLLAALAASAVSLTDELDVQARHELTVSRREQVRRAILGDPSRTVNGQPLQSGFVADMGRLPRSLRELLVAPTDASGAPIGWQVVAGLGRGWRGPYLQGEFEVVDLGAGPVHAPAFRDGWGTRATDAATDALLFGWRVAWAAADVDGDDADPRDQDLLDVGSFGRDGVPGGVELADVDYPTSPAAGDPSDPAWLVHSGDWTLDLSGWSVVVDLPADAGGGALTLRLRLLVPSVDGDAALDPDADGWLDDASLLSDAQALDTTVAWTRTFTFPAAATSPTPPTRLERVPAGVRALALVESGAPGVLLRTWPVALVPRATRPVLTLGATP